MAHVDLGHFVIRQVLHGVASALQLGHQGGAITSLGNLHAHKHLGFASLSVAIVKFRDRARRAPWQSVGTRRGARAG